MAVKSKSKSRSSTKPKPSKKATVKSKKTVGKAKSVKKTVSVEKKTSKKVEARTRTAVKVRPVKKATVEKQVKASPVTEASMPVSTRPVIVKRLLERRRTVSPASARANQFSFMKAPTPEHAFEVGDNVEVFCDHEKSRERVRGWVKGIVVQVDNKMVAVQFRSNVFLTDGWMVPDRILWYPLASEHIRPVGCKKAAVKKDFIPDY